MLVPLLKFHALALKCMEDSLGVDIHIFVVLGSLVVLKTTIVT